MKNLILCLSIGALLVGCKEGKKEAGVSPYQALADQYEEFTLTTDVTKLTDKEREMIPILIEVADLMEVGKSPWFFRKVATSSSLAASFLPFCSFPVESIAVY